MSNVIQLAPMINGNIPNTLRAIADCMEQGEYGNIKAGVMVLETDNSALELFGLGPEDKHRALAILGGAQITLSTRIFGVNKPIEE